MSEGQGRGLEWLGRLGLLSERAGREGFAGRVDSLPDGARSWEGGSPSPPGLPLTTSRRTAEEGLAGLAPVDFPRNSPFSPTEGGTA
jgi:hypothetical protein